MAFHHILNAARLIVKPVGRRTQPPSSPQSPSPTPPPAPPHGGVRLNQVYPPADSSAETDIDIIAIHGLDTKSPDTWQWKVKQKNETGEKDHVNWLEDADMLPKHTPNARIFTCDWPAVLFEDSNYAQKKIEEFARCLLAGLKHRPPSPGARDGAGDRPIVFVASCLGGVILMKALVMASHEYSSIRNATQGIVFLATPFRGTSFEDVAMWANRGFVAWAKIRGAKVSNLMKFVEGGSFEQEELVRRFSAFCEERMIKKSVFTFYEDGKTSLPRTLLPWLPDALAQEQPLVNQGSASMDWVPHPVVFHRTHVLMNKFSGPKDRDYMVVAGTINNILAKIRKGTPLERAYHIIRSERYTTDRLSIERLSGKLLPMDRCYINLVIVEQTHQKEDAAPEQQAQQSASSSLASRLRVDIPSEDITVDLPTLFSKRESHGGRPPVYPRRIMIRGRAGVGKTTLCKKIVHDFLHKDMWNSIFKRIIWVPLRNLKLLKRPFNLGSMLHQLFLNSDPKGESLGEDSWKALKATGYDKTLFLLDGLDEASSYLSTIRNDPSSELSQILLNLLEMPSVIVTSRPHTALPKELRKGFDLDLETVGFFPDQVDAYINMNFTDPEIRTPDKAKTKAFRHFLQNHELLEDIVRIPIILDALCYTWDNRTRKTTTAQPGNTMTSIYQAIEEKLWIKDAEKLNRLTPFELQDASFNEIRDSMSDDISLVQFLAFHGLINDIVVFEKPLTDDLSARFKGKGVVRQRLSQLSFLRRPDPANPACHFLHLTFQEYFAACYFAQKWKSQQPLDVLGDGQMKTIDFLQRNKYVPRYDIFWQFVAGLLEDKSGQHLCAFFHAIEGGPRDLLGPMHQRLIARCLSEVSTAQAGSAFATLQADLEAHQVKLLLLENEPSWLHYFGRESETPPAVLCSALQKASPAVRDTIVHGLTYRRSPPPSVVELLLSWLVPGTQRRLMYQIAVLSRECSQVSDKSLKQIVRRLLDDDEDLRRVATKVLQDRAPLSETVLNLIVPLLNSDVNHIRKAAIEVLAVRVHQSDNVLRHLSGRLHDNEKGVRRSALQAISEYPDLPDGVLARISALIDDGPEDVTVEALKAITRAQHLPAKITRQIAAYSSGSSECIRNFALKALAQQENLPADVLAKIDAQLKHTDDPAVRKATVSALGETENLSNVLLGRIAESLDDDDKCVREAAVTALAERDPLSDDIIRKVASRLNDDSEDVRSTTARSLLQREQLFSDLLVLDYITARLNSSSAIRFNTINMLMQRTNLAQEILVQVALQLKHPDPQIRGPAAEIMAKQQILSNVVLEQISALLLDGDPVIVGFDAIHALNGRGPLPDEVLDKVGLWLSHEDHSLGVEALNFLILQRRLLEREMKQLAGWLEVNDSLVSEVAIRFLTSQSSPPSDEVLRHISGLLGHRESHARVAAIKALAKFGQLSGHFLPQIASGLYHKDHLTKQAALQALAEQDQLPNDILEQVTALLHSHDKRSVDNAITIAALQILAKPEHVNDEIVSRMITLLDSKSETVKRATLKALAVQKRLSDDALTKIAAQVQVGNSVVRETAYETLFQVKRVPFYIVEPYLEDMFWFLIAQSWKDDICWPTDGEVSYVKYKQLPRCELEGWEESSTSRVKYVASLTSAPLAF